MSAIAVSDDADARRLDKLAVVPAGAALAVIGSIGYISVGGMEPREAYLHPVAIGCTMLAPFGCLMLSYALVQLRTALPRWTVLTSAVGLWLIATVAWGHATIVPAVAHQLTNAEFEELFIDDGWVMGVGMAPKSIVCLVGFLALAIAGWRSRSIPRSAAILFALAAIMSIWPPFPPGLILAAIAMVLLARADSKTDRSAAPA